jgi:uncharacterized protein (UPF0335 family)
MMGDLGHNSGSLAICESDAAAYMRRYEELNERKAEANADIAELLKEMTGKGHDKAAFKEAAKRRADARAGKAEAIATRDQIAALYLAACERAGV